MKTKNHFIFYWILFLSAINLTAFGQCTEAKDPEMAKYMRLTKTQDAQSCSECGMLALYFCSAKYCEKIEDKRKVGSLITACKKNILMMGQPYCCPDYINQEPQWGLMVGAAQSNQTSGANLSEYATPDNSITLIEGNSNQGYQGLTNPMTTGNNATSYGNDPEVEQLVNDAVDLMNMLSGESGATTFTNPYANPMTNSYDNTYDQDVADVINNAAALTDLLTGGDGNIGGLGDLGGYSDLGGLSSLADGLNQLGAEAEAQRQREAQAAAIRQQEQARKAAAEAEIRAKQKQLIASRRGLIAKYPDGKTPLSSNAAEANEVYFFTYSCLESTIETNTPVIYISNTFSIAKYADGTWPFKSNLMENITKAVGVQNLKLSGFYMSKNKADEQQQYLLNGARVYGFSVKEMFYSGKKASANSGAPLLDYWGNPIKTEQEQQTPQTNQVQQQATNQPQLDYWGNPINGTAANQEAEQRVKDEELQRLKDEENKRLEDEIKMEVEQAKQDAAQKNILEAERKQREAAEAKEQEQKRLEAEALAEQKRKLLTEAEIKETERKKIEAEVRLELEKKLKEEFEAKELERRNTEATAKAEQERKQLEEADLKQAERKKIEVEVRAELEEKLRKESELREQERKTIEAEAQATLEKKLKVEAQQKADKPTNTDVKTSPATVSSGSYFQVKNKQAQLRTNFKAWNNDLFVHKSIIEKLKVKKKISADETAYLRCYDECSSTIETAKALADAEQTTLEEIDNLILKIKDQLNNLQNKKSASGL